MIHGLPQAVKHGKAFVWFAVHFKAPPRRMETLLIAVVAFPLAYLSSKQVAGTLGTLFGKAAENVIVTPEHFMLVAIVGGILLVAAVLVSSISTMRLKPKQILSQME